ncbi:rhodanese-like domain-containing protein [Celeribacter sp.]|uniref:rhodanese-like domain-containing protein n=1 Tax=Celeribacter sp. TaxID=1890673 RepID=UPI003A8CF857
MTNLSRRALLTLGAGAVAVVVLGAMTYAPRRTAHAASFEHQYMTVSEMEQGGGLIVDIRTPPEWVDTGVIDGAALVTFNDPDSFLARIGPQIADGRDIYLICRSGNRTQRAADLLSGMIDNRIVSVAGGMKEQIKQGYQPVPAR